ncbi:hypothetical protein FXO38_14070 [Capsicum annuum]|nr:hypothetical protein FXO38_14070 [Capsicum annuum]
MRGVTPIYGGHCILRLNYFSLQSLSHVSAGYVAPQFENKLDHIQHQPANMREALRIEIEKELIREEIIAEEIGRRRMLEFEVRRVLMMERQLAQQSEEEFTHFSSPVMSFCPTPPFLKQQIDVTSAEERIATSQMGRRLSVSEFSARNNSGRLDIVPFEEQISEISFHHEEVGTDRKQRCRTRNLL